MSSGIYCIRNIVNDKRYVGSAINFSQRKHLHLSQLRRNIHHCIYLQRAYNKYGEDNFEFLILENVNNLTLLIEREQWWIDHTDNKYNTNPNAGSSLGYKQSDETITKRVLKNSKSVIQADKHTGKILEVWPSAKIAGLSIGIDSKRITDVCKGKSKTAGGYSWSYYNDKIILTENLNPVQYNYNKVKVCQIDINTNEIIKIWDSASLAANTVGVSTTLIIAVCKLKKKSAAGYRWRYYESKL